MEYDRKKADKKYREKLKDTVDVFVARINKDIAEKFKEKMKKDNINFKEFTLKNIEKYLNR